jgi:ADP-heptose:LPS heptosyltransferase
MDQHTTTPFFHYDCRFFRGHKPCVYRRDCEECPHYDPYSKRILIIKLGAMGDVLRTTPLLHGIKSSFPGCHITWLTLPNVIQLLAGNKCIDRLLTYSWQTCSSLIPERFDLAICLDKEADVLSFMNQVRTESRYGFALGEWGQVVPAGPSSEYLFHLGVSDELKFRSNQKSYPELIYDCVGLPYDRQEYILPDLSQEIRRAGQRLEEAGIQPGKLKIGFNTGAGSVFATKKWTVEGYVDLGKRLAQSHNAAILLLGAEPERERNSRIKEQIGEAAFDTGSGNSLLEFAGLIGQCDLLVTSDTLGMHLAIGLKRRVVALFGSTCHQEIDLFDRGVKVVTDFECSPCYLQTCPLQVNCMDDMKAEQVYRACIEALSLSEPS